MRSFLSRRSAAALLILLLVALSPGLALAGPHPRPAEPRQPAPASVLSRLGDWLRAFVEKNGAEVVDPNGAPKIVSPAPPATTDNGAEVDPDGRL